MASKKPIHQMTTRQWEASFPSEDACRTYLAKNRWPEGVFCPRCGNPEVGEHGTRAFNWVCYACSEKGQNYRFTVLVGTIFENTKYPLREWFRVIHLMLTSKKGISALQIHRMIGTGSYRTAWSMCMRIRGGMANEDFRKLMGIVEVDETFVGGKAKNRHWDKRGGGGATGGSGKAIVAGAVSRKGNVIDRLPNKFVVFPGGEHKVTHLKALDDTETNLLKTKKYGLYVMGRMTYKDTFGVDQATEYCSVIIEPELSNDVAAAKAEVPVGKSIPAGFRFTPFNNKASVKWPRKKWWHRN